MSIVFHANNNALCIHPYHARGTRGTVLILIALLNAGTLTSAAMSSKNLSLNETTVRRRRLWRAGRYIRQPRYHDYQGAVTPLECLFQFNRDPFPRRYEAGSDQDQFGFISFGVHETIMTLEFVNDADLTSRTGCKSDGRTRSNVERWRCSSRRVSFSQDRSWRINYRYHYYA